MNQMTGKSIVAILIGAYIVGTPAKIVADESMYESQTILPISNNSSSNVIKNVEESAITSEGEISLGEGFDVESSLDFNERFAGNDLRYAESKPIDLPPWTYDTSCIIDRRKRVFPRRSTDNRFLALDGDDILILHGKLKGRTKDEKVLAYMIKHYQSIDELTSYKRLMGQW